MNIVPHQKTLKTPGGRQLTLQYAPSAGFWHITVLMEADMIGTIIIRDPYDYPLDHIAAEADKIADAKQPT